MSADLDTGGKSGGGGAGGPADLWRRDEVPFGSCFRACMRHALPSDVTGLLVVAVRGYTNANHWPGYVVTQQANGFRARELSARYFSIGTRPARHAYARFRDPDGNPLHSDTKVAQQHADLGLPLRPTWRDARPSDAVGATLAEVYAAATADLGGAAPPAVVVRDAFVEFWMRAALGRDVPIVNVALPQLACPAPADIMARLPAAELDAIRTRACGAHAGDSAPDACAAVASAAVVHWLLSGEPADYTSTAAGRASSERPGAALYAAGAECAPFSMFAAAATTAGPSAAPPLPPPMAAVGSGGALERIVHDVVVHRTTQTPWDPSDACDAAAAETPPPPPPPPPSTVPCAEANTRTPTRSKRPRGRRGRRGGKKARERRRAAAAPRRAALQGYP